jgi:sensor histidine kinase YesM
MLIPSLVIQPFIENAFKHGLMHKRGAKKLVVQIIKKEKNTISIIIEDNGVGRKASSQINSKRLSHKPFAGQAIESRISLINKSHNDFHIDFNIQDLVSKTGEPLGTKVILIIYKK